MIEQDESLSHSSERSRTVALLRNVLVGGGIGLGFAVVWVVLVFLQTSTGVTGTSVSVRKPARFLLLIGLLAAVVVGGGFAGYYAMGDEVGAFVGCGVAYFLAFAGYGVRVQLTTGWTKWFTGWFDEPEARKIEGVCSH